MKTYEIRAIRSGFDETMAWVSVWYRADPRKLDVLHIVTSAVEQPHGSGSVYLERHDQSVASDSGAQRIAVSEQGIEIRLNAKGAGDLALERTMRLKVSPKLVGWKKALKVFKTVAGAPSKNVIRMVHRDSEG